MVFEAMDEYVQVAITFHGFNITYYSMAVDHHPDTLLQYSHSILAPGFPYIESGKGLININSYIYLLYFLYMTFDMPICLSSLLGSTHILLCTFIHKQHSQALISYVWLH